MNKIKYIPIVIPFFFSSSLETRTVTFLAKPITEATQEAEITVSLDPDEWLYKDFITFSVDNPAVTLSPFKSSKESVTRYDPAFKKTKKIYEHDVTLTVNASKTSDFSGDAFLHVMTLSNKYGAEENIFSLSFDDTTVSQNSSDAAASQEDSNQISEQTLSKKKDQPVKTNSLSFSAYISDMITTIQSPFIRLLLVFLLGVLLSLTPCIYPMIPITIGILQAQGSKSVFYNFLRALAYTCGMATTFALFGLLASCTGPLCGQLLMEPLFILGLVLILSYLGLSMLGLYDVYVPKFFKSPSKSAQGSSLLSSFIFGSASGTIASPCVSPGLALLLSIVATLGNKLLGFLLLFFFGIGLSTPLLIVGTFSSSLNLLPKAGMWMIEIKKLFGFMIFGMCFYYLSFIVPSTILLWFIALFIACMGIYYLHSSQKNRSSLSKKIALWFGIVLLATAIIIVFQAYRAITYAHKDNYDSVNNLWHTNYENALWQAQSEKKKLFIDFWATFCPVCLAINKTVLTKPTILDTLQKFILLKVDGTHGANFPYNELKSKFSIKGFPTFLLIDPESESIIKEWGGELYDMSEEQLITELINYL